MNYTVKKLANLSGVSVRTLHYYDQIGLLKPHIRTAAGYRLYGQGELLKLQQILFYRELDFSLKDISAIVNKGDFDLIKALQGHKAALLARKDEIDRLVQTIDNTIFKLENNREMLKPEELYDGLSKQEIDEMRQQAVKKYGDQVKHAEDALRKLTKADFEELKQDQKDNMQALFELKDKAVDSEEVQTAIATHYEIIRKFWGTHGDEDKQAKQYAGLGTLYVSDERFTMISGEAQPEFAKFLKEAMALFAKTL